MKKVYKFATGQEIPKGAIYLSTITNGDVSAEGASMGYKYVWHYFLVDDEVKDFGSTEIPKDSTGKREDIIEEVESTQHERWYDLTRDLYNLCQDDLLLSSYQYTKIKLFVLKLLTDVLESMDPTGTPISADYKDVAYKLWGVVLPTYMNSQEHHDESGSSFSAKAGGNEKST